MDEQCRVCRERPGRMRFAVSDPLPSLAMQPKVGATMTIACDQCWAAMRVERALPTLLPALARYMPCHDHLLHWDYAMFDEDVLDHLLHWLGAEA